MDIPLPGEPDPHLAKLSAEAVNVQISSPHNIPLPSPRDTLILPRPKPDEKLVHSPLPPLPPGSADTEDSNRYSPSRVTGDDDTSKDEMHDQELSLQQESPMVHSSLAAKGTRTTVLGKAQAKKRLLAFSMTKQGGGQGLSFGFNKKATNKMSAGSMPFAGTSTEDDTVENLNKDERTTSPKKKSLGKKGISRDDKARAVVSAIEEIKREEMLMRGVLGYGAQVGVLGEQTYPLPLMPGSVLPTAKPRDELEMSNILSEQQKGAIEELLGSLLTHDSDRKIKDEEKERRKSDEKRKRDSEKSSRHSKERHRSKERHSRSGRDREKEEKKHRPSELPKNWQQFRDRGFKFEEIRRLKLKLEKDKLASNNRERIRRSRDREHRSRSHEKRHKSPSQSEDKDRSTESDYDIMSKPFESTSRLIYPFMAVGVRQMQKQYPRSLIRFTKNNPSVPYCENPSTSKAYYRKREEILCEASQRVADLMQYVINGELSKSHVKNERNYKTKQTNDTNLSNSLAALQVSYDETEIDENMSSSDDANGNRRERPWFLPENLVVWPDGEEVCITTSSDAELNVKRERNDETEVESYKKKRDSSADASENKESEMSSYVNSEREREMKTSEVCETNISLRSGERTTVRSKWDSDYEEDRVQEDSNTHSSNVHSSQATTQDKEKWEGKDHKTDFAEFSAKDEIQSENRDKTASDSDNSSDSSESTSANESNTEDSAARKDKVQNENESDHKKNHKNVRDDDDDDDDDDVDDEKKEQKTMKCAYTNNQESSSTSVHPDNSGDGSTNLKLASEYEEFMKAVSFESSAMEDGQSEVPSSEHVDKASMKDSEPSDTPQEQRERRDSGDAIDSEASHDKLDIEPARVEETQQLKKFSGSKLHNKPKLMTSSASEDELMLPEEEEKQDTKSKTPTHAEQNNTLTKRDKKHRSSSSDSSSSSESTVESEEEVKEKRKSKSRKVSKKKRKKVIHSKKRQRKASKKKRVDSSSSSETESSSNVDSSSSSTSDGVSKKKVKHKEKNRRRAKSSSSEVSENDTSSENPSSDDHAVRKKKKKKKKAKRVPKKKISKKRKRSRKDSESSDSEENVRSRRSKATRHKNSKKEVSKENDSEQHSEEKPAAFEDSDGSSYRKDSETRNEHTKRQSGKGKGGCNEVENNQRKIAKKYSNKDNNSSVDESGDEDRERKSGSRKKGSSSSYKKSNNYHESETTEDESERKTIKKRRRERRSCTTSPVVSSNKKRRRSPSTSPEHSPTPQRRNSTEGKSGSQRERSKEQSSGSRKLKHSSGSNKKGHKQKTLEVSEDADDYSEECTYNRKKGGSDFRSHNILDDDEWEVNSEQENSYDTNSNSREEANSEDTEDIFSKESPRKHGYREDFPAQLIRDEDIKKEILSEEDEERTFLFMGNESSEENVEEKRTVSVKHSQRCVSDDEDDGDDDDDDDEVDYQKKSHVSLSCISEHSNLEEYGDKYSFVQIKVEPNDDAENVTGNDAQISKGSQLYSPCQQEEEEDSKSQPLKSQQVINRELCSTDSSQFSQIPEKVMERFGSDISQDSFKDIGEANFTGKLFRKQNFSNISDDSIRSGSQEFTRILPSRGTNFSLDNIPLPPVPTDREETDNVTQLQDSSCSSRVNKTNFMSGKLPNLPPPELLSPSMKVIKPSSQRHVISFKLLSPSSRLQSSQALVDTSDNLDDEDSSLSKQQHVTKSRGIVHDDILESGKEVETESDRKNETSIFESSKDEWVKEHNSDSVSLSASVTADGIVPDITSSSKAVTDTTPEKLSIPSSNVHPKERTRKRPSRWGMTTVPPKKKVIEELYDSLPIARSETAILSPTANIKKFYDCYVSNDHEQKENEIVKTVHNISSLDTVAKKGNESFNKKLQVSCERKRDFVDKDENKKFSSWELQESEDRSESWETSRGKDIGHKTKYTHEQWRSKQGGRVEFTVERIEKDSSEECGPVIDWENDLEQSKGMNDSMPVTDNVNLFQYTHEGEVSKNSSQGRSSIEKQQLSQDESESEWESREVNFHSKSSAFRQSEVKNDTKEKVIRERSEPCVEKSAQRSLVFDDEDRLWDDRRWRCHDHSVVKHEDRRHREELHDSRREDHGIRKDVCERSKRRIDEEGIRMDDVYRDIRSDERVLPDNDRGKSRVDEIRVKKEQDEHKFRESIAEKRNDERDSVGPEAPSGSPTKHSEDMRLNEEYARNDKHDDQHRKGEKEKGSRDRERCDLEEQDNEDSHAKNRKEYAERTKRDIEERDRDDRIRKHSGERERDRREVVDDQRREDRSRKEYLEGERGGIRDKERRESEIRDSRHDELTKKEYSERERSSARDRERRDSRDRRDERRRDRERDRRGDRRERDRWEREKRERHREDRESNRRSRSPIEYHHDRDRRDSHRVERGQSHSPSADYWQGEWDRPPKDRDCDCSGNYYVQDIPLPVNSTMTGAGVWPSGATGEADMELSCSPASSPLVGFKRSLADSTISDSELVSCKQEDVHRSQEMSPSAYPQGITPNKLYERKHASYLKKQVVGCSPSADRPPSPANSPSFSPKRLSLDDRIEMELGVKNTNPLSAAPQYQVYQQPPPPQQQLPLQQQLPPTSTQQQQQQQQQQQPVFSYAQYYAHVPPPTQYDARNDKFLSMPPPPFGQPVDEYGPPQHMYPPPPVKPLMTQMPPPVDAPVQKRRPPLLPTPNIRPLTNWDSPEAFIGAQPHQSSRVVQVGNFLQVVPVEVPPPSVPPQSPSSQSLVLQTGNVLQVIPGENTVPNTLPPPVPCGELLPVSNASSQVVQVGNVLQVIPGPTTSAASRSGTVTVVAPPKSTFPLSSTHNSPQGLPTHMPPVHLPPMHGPPPNQGPGLLPSPSHGPPNHLPPPHGPPTHLPPLHGPPTHPPPSHCPPPHTPPIRVPPIHTPPIQVQSVHGLTTHSPSPSQAVPILMSPGLEMSPSPIISSPLMSAHGPVPPPASGMKVTVSVATSSPITSNPALDTTVMSGVSSATRVIPSNIVPTPVAAPISYSPPASPFLVPPVVHAPMVQVGLPEGTSVAPSQGDCPIPFLSSVEMAQASQLEEAERRRAERARRRAEKEKRRKEKEKRHQNKLKQATEMIIKKALEREGEMLGTVSDIDLEEMRLIEEAMQQVPEQEEEEEEEEEVPQTDMEQHLKKKKKKLPSEMQPLPPAGKGILVSPGFREKPLGCGGIERKSVKFADGIRPGEGTSPSAGEDLPSPPPPPRKLPKEKRYKKKKKKKIKVKIIRQINVEDEDDDDEDISPPPPPPGSPPPPPMYPPGAHYPPTYPSGFTYSTAPPFTVLPGVDSSTGAAAGTGGNLFTPLYHQHHHTTTTTHTTTVQFAPPPPPVTPVPPPTNPHIFKREAKSNP